MKKNIICLVTFITLFSAQSTLPIFEFIGNTLYFLSTPIRVITRRAPFVKSLHIRICPHCQNARSNFLKAAKNGDINLLNECLDHNVDVNITDGKGNTALHLAIKYGKIEIIQRLLTHKKDIDDKLFIAKYIWDYPADQCINFKNKNKKGNRSIHDAAQYNISEAIPLFLLANENINITNDKGYTPLMITAQFDSDQTAHELLNNGAIYTITDPESKETIMHIAIMHDNHNCLGIFVERCAELINVKDKKNNSPLSLAINKQKIEMVRKLITRNAIIEREDISYVIREKKYDLAHLLFNAKQIDLNALDINGETPLTQSIKFSDMRITELLLSQKNIDLNQTNKSGDTPLALAVKYKNNPLLENLYSKGATICAESVIAAINRNDQEIMHLLLQTNQEALHKYHKKTGLTPFLTAVKNNNMQIVQQLLEHYPVSLAQQSKKMKNNCLHYAIENKNLQMLRLLCNKGANIEQADFHGFTALLYAAQRNNTEFVQELINMGANITARDKKEGNTCLSYAILNKNETLARHFCIPELIKIKNLAQKNAWHLAAEQDWMVGIDLLGHFYAANINDLDESGYAPITYAVVHNNVMMMKYLHEQQGASLQILTSEHKNILHIATENAVENNVFSYLLERTDNLIYAQNKDNITPLQSIVEKENISMLEIVCKQGIDISKQYGSWRNDTLLHRAISSKNKPMAETLIKYKADLNLQNNTGQTPAHYALSVGEIHILQKLVQSGADINLQNNYGNTLLHLATQYMLDDVTQYLLQKGANPNIANKDKQLPLHIAIEHNAKETCKLLIDQTKEFGLEHNDESNILQYALEQNNLYAFEEILSKISRKKTEYAKDFIAQTITNQAFIAAQKNNLSALKICKKYNANLHTVDQERNTLLHYASQAGNEQLIEYVLAEQRIPYSINAQGHTPIITAVIHKNYSAVQYLLKQEYPHKYEAQAALKFQPNREIRELLSKYVDTITGQENRVEQLFGYIDQKQNTNKALEKDNALLYDQIHQFMSQHGIQVKIAINRPLSYVPESYAHLTQEKVTAMKIPGRHHFILHLEKIERTEESAYTKLKDQNIYYANQYQKVMQLQQEKVAQQTKPSAPLFEDANSATETHEHKESNGNDNEDALCIICYEKGNLQNLSCKHCKQSDNKIHATCQQQWTGQHNTCPHCNSTL